MNPSEPPDIGPRARARRRAFLDAAAALFKEKGYEQVTLSDVIERAGGSKATLYELFGDKEGLFRAVIEESNARFVDHLAAAVASSDRTPEQALTVFGLCFVGCLMQPDALAFLRGLIADGGRIATVAETFYRHGPQATEARVADYLRAAAAAGQLRIADPLRAAQAFINMMVGPFLLRRLILPHETVPAAEIEAHVRSAVRLFLEGAGAASDSRS